MRDLAGDPVRVAVVGLGRWGRTLAGAMTPDTGLRLVSCFSRTPESRKAFSSDFGCDAATAYAELLARPDLEAVIVTTPNHHHFEPVVEAARAGKHVMVEKPIATTIADARAMVDTCRSHGITLAVASSSRYLRGYRVCRRILDSDGLGPIAMVEASYTNERGRSYTPDNWHWYRKAVPGGPLLQGAIHQLDNLYYLFGPIRRVSAEFRKFATRSELPDVCVLWMEFESGVLGTLGTSFVSPGNPNRRNQYFINAYGERANLYHDRWTGTRLFRLGAEDCERVPYQEFEGYDYLGVELREFAEAVGTPRRPEVDGDDGMHVLAVVLAAIRSSELQRPVAVGELLCRKEDA